MSRQRLVPYVHSDGKVWDHFFVDPRSEIIYFAKRHNGRKIKFSTGERVPNGLKAKTFANREFDKRIGKRTANVRNLIKEEIVLWRKVKDAEGLDHSTLIVVDRAVRQILPFWGDKLPDEINRDSFAEWCVWWQENLPGHQMENALKYFRNFCRYMNERIVNGRPVLLAIPRMRDPNRKEIEAKRAQKKERSLTDSEIRTIFETAPGRDERLIAEFMYAMASRIEETCTLRFGHEIMLDLEPPIYRWSIGQNKADHAGQHALPTRLIEPLRAQRKASSEEGSIDSIPHQSSDASLLKSSTVQPWSGPAKKSSIRSCG